MMAHATQSSNPIPASNRTTASVKRRRATDIRWLMILEKSAVTLLAAAAAGIGVAYLATPESYSMLNTMPLVGGLLVGGLTAIGVWSYYPRG